MKQDFLDIGLFIKYLDEKAISENSKRQYVGAVTRFLKEDPNIDDFSSYNTFIVKKCIKKRAYRDYYALRHFIRYKFNKTEAENLINKIIKIKQQDKKDSLQPLSEKEITDVINCIQEYRHQLIAIIQFLTGIRASDVLRLKKKDIYWEKINDEEILRLNITAKGNKRLVRYIFKKEFSNMIMDYINKLPIFKQSILSNKVDWSEYVFIKERKQDRNEVTLQALLSYCYLEYWHDLKQALNSNSIDIHRFATHDFRRNFAKKAWTKYQDVDALKRLLGHSDGGTTLRYLRQTGFDVLTKSKELQFS